MKPASYKYKIYGLVAGTVVACLIFFVFVYGAMNQHNQVVANQVAQKNQDYQQVLAEQQSYVLGKQDVAELAGKSVQPQDLFSRDTSVVKEIKVLESVAGNFGIKFTLQIAGTVKTVPKAAKTSAQLLSVPAVITVEGPFDKIVNFIDTMEHLQFITQTKTLTMSALSGDNVHTTLNSEFYIQP